MLDTRFCTASLDWIVFGLRTLDTIVILYLFCLCVTPVIIVSTSFGGYSIDEQCKSTDWFLCDLDALIKVYSSYIIYVLFILFINLFTLCCLYFSLLILLILLFVVIDFAFAYSLFKFISL